MELAGWLRMQLHFKSTITTLSHSLDMNTYAGVLKGGFDAKKEDCKDSFTIYVSQLLEEIEI
jgi:hypothetical protein